MKRASVLAAAALALLPLAAACDSGTAAPVPPGCYLDKAGSVVCPPPPTMDVDIAQHCYVYGFDTYQCEQYAREHGWPG